MATEKRLIDVSNENVKAVLEKYPYYPDEIWKFMSMTGKFPTVYAVEVVRCKDCEFWNDGWFPECTMGKCKRGKPVLTEPHHYCSYGVRRLDVPVIIKDESFVVKEETKK